MSYLSLYDRDDPIMAWDPEFDLSQYRGMAAPSREQARKALLAIRAGCGPAARSPERITLVRTLSKACLSAQDVPLAQDVFHEVVNTGGPGSAMLQRALIGLIMDTNHPESVAFWTGLLPLVRPRDQFTPQRRKLALIALAQLITVQGSPAAFAALCATICHPDPVIASDAITLLGRIYRWLPKPSQPKIRDEITNIAGHGTAFLPRLAARLTLAALRRPVPSDIPDGSYVIRVNLGRISRTIEIRADRTLDDLHLAIQGAFRWDSDHLYAFYLDGSDNRKTTRYVFGPSENFEFSSGDFTLGQLGLVRGAKFTYLFDFGDRHVFSATVVSVKPTVDASETLPRVVADSGTAPPQYESM